MGQESYSNAMSFVSAILLTQFNFNNLESLNQVKKSNRETQHLIIRRWQIIKYQLSLKFFFNLESSPIFSAIINLISFSNRPKKSLNSSISARQSKG